MQWADGLPILRKVFIEVLGLCQGHLGEELVVTIELE